MTEFERGWAAAIEAAAKAINSSHPYMFAGHMNDYRRNRDAVVSSILALQCPEQPAEAPKGE
jgi:hypothetical protein